MNLRESNQFSAAYYVPTIPDVYSTDRYQHALSVAEYAEESHLISNNSVPEVLSERATSTTILSSEGVLARGREAAATARELVGSDGLFVTSYHYEAALAGLLAGRPSFVPSGSREKPTWVADIYESPAQYRLNQPHSYHRVTAIGLATLLKSAPYGIHSVHPNTPYQYGQTRSFLNNGAPVDQVTPTFSRNDPLRIVWVGSPRSDRGGSILADALTRVDAEIKLDIYGQADDEFVRTLDRVGDRHDVTLHGHVEHSACLRAIEMADVGYGVLPRRKDWRYAPPIKVGEYLAGGTIPLVSQLPGTVQIAGPAGWYVTPTDEAAARAIDMLAGMAVDKFTTCAEAARNRAEAISWRRLRSEFATQLAIAHGEASGRSVVSVHI
ncbi:glycosyltransferase [Haloterrigena sp. SYSU A121-1]|uniref:Glycosyltransferase n=1 Tax=Haloterrigena gelatinilytica TaxID=2741724 RepID=A0A8J8GPY9_9EURY|nr:glycosyltransferase [Haloterrigena gelatinilytica]NUB93228.1 glycosyltransferase [Haloterrigena gelatinilytica]